MGGSAVRRLAASAVLAGQVAATLGGLLDPQASLSDVMDFSQPPNQSGALWLKQPVPVVADWTRSASRVMNAPPRTGVKSYLPRRNAPYS